MLHPLTVPNQPGDAGYKTSPGRGINPEPGLLTSCKRSSRHTWRPRRGEKTNEWTIRNQKDALNKKTLS